MLRLSPSAAGTGGLRALATKARTAIAGLALAAVAATAGAQPAAAATGSMLTTTFHHPFYDIAQAAFVDAADLHTGDQLETADGGTAVTVGLRLYHQTTTYDLTIDGLHTYYVLARATPVLVHNCGTGEAFPDRELPRDSNGRPTPDGEYPTRSAWHEKQ